MTKKNVLLIACGCFNPPTIMHLRLFELAKDHLTQLEQYNVVGGIISPVHDQYEKKSLIASKHRNEMVRLSLMDSDWIRLSTWETEQQGWSRTRATLDNYHRLIEDVRTGQLAPPLWMPEAVKEGAPECGIKLICGADLLESFNIPGLWANEDIAKIVSDYGMCVISREGSNPQKFIYESDLLTQYKSNIHLITEWIQNDISSTKVRRAIQRNESVRYLVPDAVLNYISENNLYKTSPLK